VTFDDILEQALEMLRRRGRVSYRALKVQFPLDDDLLALLRDEIVEVHQLARDQEGTMLVMPTMGTAAPKIEPDPVIDSKERSQRNRAGLTTAFSLASAPALSLCCGFTAANLPIGLQIGGKPFAEQTVLNVAYAYQHATDWHRRRPPI
jgi:Asp-tRNA(Asn)/Glu-tRNA(Gln) amidotransferase A subunit family amidase